MGLKKGMTLRDWSDSQIEEAYNLINDKGLSVPEAAEVVSEAGRKIDITFFFYKLLDWKQKNGKIVITDIGKAHALHEAGWSNKMIAQEFGTTEERVIDALETPKPGLEKEVNEFETPEIDFYSAHKPIRRGRPRA